MCDFGWFDGIKSMPLRKNNSRVFHRTLYGGILEKVRLHKRLDDMQASTITTYIVFQARRRSISKTGQPIQGDMFSDHRTQWWIPRVELDRLGIDHLNHLDVIQDLKNRYWQSESTTKIDVRLFENFVKVWCLRFDPPADVLALGAWS